MIHVASRHVAAFAITAAAVSLLVVGVEAQSGAAVRTRAGEVTTPSTASGRPDLTGLWTGGRGGNPDLQAVPGSDKPDDQGNLRFYFQNRPCAASQLECLPGTQDARDRQFRARMDPNRPVYKPEFWDRVQYLDVNGNTEDPGFSCFPQGVPRMGAPNQIVQTPTQVIFLYQGRSAFRAIPIDGRTHETRQVDDITWFGHPVGRWEGDTLVVDSVGFTDETWLANPGYFHSNNMRVVERLRRTGDTLTYQVTVIDPEVLMEPWVMNARTLRINPDPAAYLEQDLPCDERDREHMMTKERH